MKLAAHRCGGARGAGRRPGRRPLDRAGADHGRLPRRPPGADGGQHRAATTSRSSASSSTPRSSGPSEDLARYPRDEAGDAADRRGGRRGHPVRAVRRRDLPARLRHLGRSRGAGHRPGGRRAARPLPGRGHGLHHAVRHRPAGARLLRSQGRAAGGGRQAGRARPGDAAGDRRLSHRARPGRPGALVAQRLPLSGRASERPGAAARPAGGAPGASRRRRSGRRRGRGAGGRAGSDASTTSRSPTWTARPWPPRSASAPLG